MKKMNFNFLGLKAKIVLPLFLFVGLFMISATSVNAQYVTAEQAKEILDIHLNQLPPMTASIKKLGQERNSKMAVEDMNLLRHRYGQSIVRKIGDGFSISNAIEKTYDSAQDRVPAQAIDLVKQEYVDLLKIN